MTASSVFGYYQHGHNNHQLLPMDMMIQIFMHLSQQPQDLLNCALTTRQWSRPALQELYRHPWSYLFSYQFDTEGRVMDKLGSILLLRTLFHACLDPSRTTFPYPSFARSVNLKWVHDTFDLREVDIQALTGFRWTRNEAPKDFLIRCLLANRPYLSDFVHCHAPGLPRCLFAHMTTVINNFVEEDTGDGANATTVLTADNTAVEGSITDTEPANTINTANTASTDSDDWANMMQQATDDEYMVGLNVSLLATPPLLPVQPIATAMPLVHSVTDSISTTESSPLSLDGNDHTVQSTVIHSNNPMQMSELAPSYTPPSPITLVSTVSLSTSSSSSAQAAVIDEVNEATASAVGENTQMTAAVEHVDETIGVLDVATSHLFQTIPIVTSPSLSAFTTTTVAQPMYNFQQPYMSEFTHLHPRATSASSSALSSSRPILAAWPLTMEQTHSLVYLDLRYAIVSDSLIISLSMNCRKIEFLKVATHWQHYPHSYSVTDQALALLVAAQQELRLVHVENHREISQGHELVRTINVLASTHGPTLETLVLKSHDFQNCDLASLGKACTKLKKFSAPGGIHLFREEVIKLIEGCKLTLEHLDFSNSDIETDSLMSIMKGMSTPAAAKGVLKALILLGMEDTLNQETCLAIGEHGSGLNCFRLDILESEAKDVSMMLSRPCASNLRVLTLGCHDVHGDLANDILEQIALNCQNVELLDINHWQFSEKALENVLRECGMLRYLNVSYTDIGESTADIICKCLGEVKRESIVSTAPLPEDTLSAQVPSNMLSPTQLQTPAATYSSTASITELTPEQVGDLAESKDELTSIEQEMMESTADSPDEERPDLSRKRGMEMRLKDESEEDDGEYMDTNMDSDQQDVMPAYSTNGGYTKKQSQHGLVHYHTGAMALRTIMNLDLDEVIETDLSMNIDEDTSMDLDMRLDLQRYHRNITFKSFDRDDEIDSEQLEHNAEDKERECGETMMTDTGHGEDTDEQRILSKEAKGKGVYIDKGSESPHHGAAVFASIVPLYSSYGPTSLTASSAPSSGSSSSSGSSLSSSSSSSSASSSASSSSSASLSSSASPSYSENAAKAQQNGQVLLTTAEAGNQRPFLCIPLLPALPIPSKQAESQGVCSLAVPTSSSIQQACGSTSTELNASNRAEMVSNEIIRQDSMAADNCKTESATTMTTACTEAPSSISSSKETEEMPMSTPQSEVVSESDEKDDSSFVWTRDSRLEQVNVEYCSLLSVSTMSKIKALSIERQANFVQRGRKKTRIWVENEHDMMMTRLAMERGPELPAARQRANTIVEPSGACAAAPNSGSQRLSTPTTFGVEGESIEQNQQSSQQSQQVINTMPGIEEDSLVSTAAIEVIA
ncbi:hypothetical protein BX616_001263 [Lobosporangium transversale]|nr:hypothetical protein BX616_001263 [Lobosporangium transversale]